MIGTYKYDDCTVKDPTVTLLDLNKYFDTEEPTQLMVEMYGENVGSIPAINDGCQIAIFDNGTMPPVTNEPALQSWAETRLQQYRID